MPSTGDNTSTGDQSNATSALSSTPKVAYSAGNPHISKNSLLAWQRDSVQQEAIFSDKTFQWWLSRRTPQGSVGASETKRSPFTGGGFQIYGCGYSPTMKLRFFFLIGFSCFLEAKHKLGDRIKEATCDFHLLPSLG